MTLHNAIQQTCCPSCRSEQNHEDILGTFGRLTWIKCHACGTKYHYTIKLESEVMHYDNLQVAH